jgi:hypothetical protein
MADAKGALMVGRKARSTVDCWVSVSVVQWDQRMVEKLVGSSALIGAVNWEY